MPDRLNHFINRRRWPTIAGAILFLALASTTFASGSSGDKRVGSNSRVGHYTSVFYTDTTSGPVVEGIQNGSGIGVEGVVGITAGSIGILGYENNTALQGIGLEGQVKGPNSTALYGQDLNSNHWPAASPPPWCVL